MSDITSGPAVEIRMSRRQATLLSQLAAYAAVHMYMLPEAREEAELLSGMLEPESLADEGMINDFTA